MNIDLLYRIFQGLDLFLRVVGYILLAYCVMSWFVRPTNRIFMVVSRFTQPLIAPFRPIANKLMQRGFMIDISVLLAFFALRIVQSLLPSLFQFLMSLF